MQITFSGEDPTGAALAFTVADEPSCSAQDGEPPLLIYMPMAGFNGQDRFTFTASNAITTSRPAEVTIVVRPALAADTQPPQVRWTLPADGAIGVAAGARVLYEDAAGPIYAPTLAIAFVEPMDEASLGCNCRRHRAASRHLPAVDIEEVRAWLIGQPGGPESFHAKTS